jgi:hypothetical protein
MESVLGNHYTMPGRIGILVARETGEFEETFIRFRSTVAKENFPRANFFNQSFRQPDLFRNREKIGAVDELAGLGRYFFNPMGMTVTKISYGNTSGEI